MILLRQRTYSKSRQDAIAAESSIMAGQQAGWLRSYDRGQKAVAGGNDIYSDEEVEENKKDYLAKKKAAQEAVLGTKYEDDRRVKEYKKSHPRVTRSNSDYANWQLEKYGDVTDKSAMGTNFKK